MKKYKVLRSVTWFHEEQIVTMEEILRWYTEEAMNSLFNDGYFEVSTQEWAEKTADYLQEVCNKQVKMQNEIFHKALIDSGLISSLTVVTPELMNNLGVVRVNSVYQKKTWLEQNGKIISEKIDLNVMLPDSLFKVKS